MEINNLIMKGVIVYKSKYGATSQYSKWLADELGLPLVKAEEFHPKSLSDFDFVILAGSIYIGKWLFRDWVKQNAEVLKSKKLFFVMVCGTPLTDFKEQERLTSTNIPTSLVRNSDIIFLRGRVVIKRLSLMDKLALKFASSMVSDPIKKKEMQEGYDDVSRTNLVDVIRKVRQYLLNINVKKAEASLA